ncbi:hypothetical protein Leryth_020195 [Lithospermum erythrorhizon]|nr:hypothetical protein Leryth_020195 [Lithospermum erythrorhizon]
MKVWEGKGILPNLLSSSFGIKMDRENEVFYLRSIMTGNDAGISLPKAFYGRRLNNIKWLGIRPTDIVGHKVSVDQRTFSMTDKDIKTVKDMLLKDAYLKNRPQWLHELHIMLKIKQKVEIESLCCFGVVAYLTEVFLSMKLQQEDWI